MNKQELFLSVFLLFISLSISSQSPQIGIPKLEFDGQKLLISYNIINENQSDQFYVWVVIQKKDGQILKMNSISGDLGDIKPGKNKLITWEPAKDSVFLNEEVTVKVNAEKYVKSYNKGSAILLSVLVPGLGQSKMSKGKPFWLMGVASYGALAGGLVTYSGYKSNYDKYLAEETDPKKRADYLNQAEKQANMSGALFVTAAAIWTTNLIWVALTPNRYQPLKYKPLTLSPSADPLNGAALLTLRYKF
ncbi:MAG: hypothetical protein A2X05_00540 [Bacteroidetes bacterium GWE2_41_25]|nr:MAG: hypothetical protein A2X03_12925 [Bacteroidetes bacterium GWA2_40_15]OFX82852.1 MAG: hypothetical protein A2X06_03970 [Bacteroidetes bacterium GWC2_40_22]OFX95855.1 MAG: hypothetical protein A2X05_00540 [Bacteroidetes bacterium GWE2_41_25]OFY61385.1 MAG: hypothetical protein A2X04_15575 [Bacteroidetes bacterium GWF2_41_9]HAM11163.1 hypothetical protein [Bacteroidales bacterium]